MRAGLRIVWLQVAGLLILGALAQAAPELRVGAGSSLRLGDNVLRMGCADVFVAGTLEAGSVGIDGVRDVAIGGGGMLDAQSATLSLAGSWQNLGSFVAGASQVEMTDGCSLLSATISGDTTFNDLSLQSASGFQYSLGVGSTQTVGGSLSFLGTSGSLLQLRSTSDGNAAALEAQGAVSASFVDVRDADASAGNTIALDLESKKRGNTPGWSIGPAVVLNEVDIDTPGSDTQQFVELSGPPGTALDGLALVLYDGADDASYEVYDLDGFATDLSEGLFVAGNAAVPVVDLVIPNGSLQLGADAVALYVGSASDFPGDTPVTVTNLIDALVYDTDDPDDVGLLTALTPGNPQLNESENGTAEEDSLGRVPSGGGQPFETTAFQTTAPTPGAVNMPEPSRVPALALGFALLVGLNRRRRAAACWSCSTNT